MEFKSNIPIYLQVVDDIKKQIAIGSLRPGDRLPSTRDLAAMYQINPNTATRVYSELELLGISFTKRGLGTFLSENPELKTQLHHEMIELLVTGFIEELKAIGCSKEEIIAEIEKNF